jgi:hypothetical protein
MLHTRLKRVIVRGEETFFRLFLLFCVEEVLREWQRFVGMAFSLERRSFCAGSRDVDGVRCIGCRGLYRWGVSEESGWASRMVGVIVGEGGLE